jgi:hypothetical protein
LETGADGNRANKKRGIMKTIALTLFAAALGIAQNQPSSSTQTTPAASAAAPSKTATPSKAPSKKPAEAAKASPEQKAKTPVPAPTIPPGAVEVEPYLFRYQDASGKTWMYRQTPFGLSKWEETSTPVAPEPAKSEPVVVTDLGDSVRFERNTPFGKGTWVRKKTELNDEEKALISGSNSTPEPTDKTKGDK